ncbi:hypothetical protein TVAG_005990 [Trichomonas vaginalis G3]|uniref:OB-fold nucleic acid binding domain containing protein n=1 Tax=Trichomonas vaginalis (strain ATCC PRA-98 / G3) TaxID=412133 RepID=A2E706_TRIV3|nr:DNA metabolic process [Trichomonas vaginalis G3]EAY11524.1 hypothetical protein TVAG_005990 [Trichomonas vaginalis G3]KAI5489408.1 DNA metabolic process [Trichomonas vaginalis G3]|eukprot:XP_001323747.1 hypothetical protein [Trichomonas vaginalis G3]
MSITSQPENDHVSSERTYEIVRTNVNIIPVTIKQILNAEVKDNAFMINGVQAKVIRIIGKILSHEEQDATTDKYVLNDCSGTIEAFESVDPSNVREPFEDNRYVAITGMLKFENDSKSLSIESIEYADDYNRITYHALDTIHAHLYFTKGGFPQNTIYTAQNREPYQPNTAHADTKAASEGDIDQGILSCMKSHGEGAQVTKSEIISALKDKFSVVQIEGRISKLNEDGLIYQADEDTYSIA